MQLPDNELDLTIRNAVIVNASTTMRGDIGVGARAHAKI